MENPAPRLSEQQLQVVTYADGPLLVVAGPGSGKTRVLTERIRHLISAVPGHFRILALTFTNKAAAEMKDRLNDLGHGRDRAFIGTMHGFCLELLTERGRMIGLSGPPNIFERFADRADVLERAVQEDAELSEMLVDLTADKQRQQLSKWLSAVSAIKSQPISSAVIGDEVLARVYEAYEAGMRASNAYDFDDLLLLAYRLFVEHPALADVYRRTYKYICIDEAQDMNEAQYAVLTALCGDSHRNVMLVGDPRQSIYGFNTASPEYLSRFSQDFGAARFQLSANFRSARSIVSYARTLEPKYAVNEQLPIKGDVKVLVGKDEGDEARLISTEIANLQTSGHADIEGIVSYDRFAILGRTKFALLAVQQELTRAGIPHHFRMTVSQDNESEVVDAFFLALRVRANQRDRLHLASLAKRWGVSENAHLRLDELIADSANKGNKDAAAIQSALATFELSENRLNLMPAFDELAEFAKRCDEPMRRAIMEDLAVARSEWDHFLRSSTNSRSLTSYLSSKSLGSAQLGARNGVSLLTIHASKGLEFDVVFLAGMAEGIFPDFRATSVKQQAEERRNAFVAATRAKRLLFLSYSRTRRTPWGEIRTQRPSRFLDQAEACGS